MKNEASRLLQKLVIDGILTEVTSKADNQYQTITTILRVNRKAELEIKSGRRKITLEVVAKVAKTAKAKGSLKTKKVPLASINQWPCDQSQGNNEQHGKCVEEIESELRRLRDTIIQKGRKAGVMLKNYHIYNNDLINSIADLMPRSITDLHALDGWSKNKMEKYGNDVIGVVCRVLDKYGIRPKSNNNGQRVSSSVPPKRKGTFSDRAKQSKRHSFESYSYGD